MLDEKNMEIKELPKLYKVSIKLTKKDELQQEIPPSIDYQDIRIKMIKDIINKNKYLKYLINKEWEE